jgi:hypothetical protein
LFWWFSLVKEVIPSKTIMICLTICAMGAYKWIYKYAVQMLIIKFFYYHIMMMSFIRKNIQNFNESHTHTLSPYIYIYIFHCYHNFHPPFQLSLNIILLVSLFICSNFIVIDKYCLQVSCLSSISSIKKWTNAYHEHKIAKKWKIFFSWIGIK